MKKSNTDITTRITEIFEDFKTLTADQRCEFISIMRKNAHAVLADSPASHKWFTDLLDFWKEFGGEENA